MSMLLHRKQQDATQPKGVRPMYTYTINISRKYQRNLRDHGYSHYFRIETDLIKDELKGLTSELSLIYPDPDYKITVYRNTRTSQEVEI